MKFRAVIKATGISCLLYDLGSFLNTMKVELMQVVLDLLQIPFDQKEDVRMNELMRLAHQFLQNFCLSNQNNQVSYEF